MITAKEARKRTNTRNKEGLRVAKEKQRAEKIINKAIEDGRHFCWLGFYASNATCKYLESLGYKVTRTFNLGDWEDDTQVKW